MSSATNICVVLKPSDIGRKLKFDYRKLPQGTRYSLKFIDKVGEVYGRKYLTVHHMVDEGKLLAMELVSNYDTYEKALNLVLGGELNRVMEPFVLHYCAWEGKDWEICRPLATDEEPEIDCVFYKFENGEWHVKIEGNWIKVKEMLGIGRKTEETCEVG